MGGFRGLSGIAVDSFGKVYVLDPGYGDDFVQEFTQVGNHMQFDSQFGSQGSGMGQFNGPYGIAVDSSGNIFVADSGNNRIQKFDSNGNFLLAWGCANATTTACQSDLQGNGEMWGPSYLTTDSFGNVYVSDPGNERVQKFDNDGNYITQWGCPDPNSTNFVGGACVGDNAAPGHFNGPGGIAVDSSGNVFVADLYNNRIEKFNETGSYLDEWGSKGSGQGQFSLGPHGVAVDSLGDVYVTNYNITGGAIVNDAKVEKFDGSGHFIEEFGRQGMISSPDDANGQFELPEGIAVDPNAGYVYVTDVDPLNSWTISLFGDLGGGPSLTTHVAPGMAAGSVSPNCQNACIETVGSSMSVQATPSPGNIFSTSSSRSCSVPCWENRSP